MQHAKKDTWHEVQHFLENLTVIELMSIMSRVNALKPQLYMQNHAEHHYANTSKGLWVQAEKNVNENK